MIFLCLFNTTPNSFSTSISSSSNPEFRMSSKSYANAMQNSIKTQAKSCKPTLPASSYANAMQNTVVAECKCVHARSPCRLTQDDWKYCSCAADYALAGCIKCTKAHLPCLTKFACGNESQKQEKLQNAMNTVLGNLCQAVYDKQCTPDDAFDFLVEHVKNGFTIIPYYFRLFTEKASLKQIKELVDLKVVYTPDMHDDNASLEKIMSAVGKEHPLYAACESCIKVFYVPTEYL